LEFLREKFTGVSDGIRIPDQQEEPQEGTGPAAANVSGTGRPIGHTLGGSLGSVGLSSNLGRGLGSSPSAVAVNRPPNDAALSEWRKRLRSRQYWMPDAVSSDCYSCQAKFTTIRRRHHCR